MSVSMNMIKKVNQQYARVGDILQYTIEIHNDGDEDLNEVVVEDILSGSLEFVLGSVMIGTQIMPDASVITGIPLGRLLIGDKKVIKFKAKLIGGIGTTLTNIAKGTYLYIIDDNKVQQGSSKSNSIGVVVMNPSIKITKIADKSFVMKGNQLTYTVTLVNNGDLEAQNIRFWDQLPEGVVLVEGSFEVNGVVINQVDIQKGINIGNIPVGGSIEITYKVQVIDAECRGWIRNQAYVKFTYVFPNEIVGEVATVAGIPGSFVETRLTPLMISKLPQQKEVIVDEVVTYTLEVENIGEVPLEKIVISDPLVEQLDFVIGSVKVDGEIWKDANVITGIEFAQLMPYESHVITFDVKILSNKGTPIVNVAQGNYKYQLPDDRIQKDCTSSNEAVLRISNPHIKISKKANTDFALLGDIITYQVDLSNDGDLEVDNVIFVDELPKEVRLIQGSFKVDGKSVNEVELDKGVNIGEIELKQSKVIEYKVEVVSSNCKGWIVNQANITFDYTLMDGALGQITSTDGETGSKVMVEIGMSNFKQFSVENYLGIPESKPNIETINTVTGAVEIINSHVIKTPNLISVEGQRLTGYKLIVRGALQLVIEYTALNEQQTVHSEHYNVPFSTFIILPSQYTVGSRIQIEGIVEDIYYKAIDTRNFFSNTSLLVNARIAGC